MAISFIVVVYYTKKLQLIGFFFENGAGLEISVPNAGMGILKCLRIVLSKGSLYFYGFLYFYVVKKILICEPIYVNVLLVDLKNKLYSILSRRFFPLPTFTARQITPSPTNSAIYPLRFLTAFCCDVTSQLFSREKGRSLGSKKPRPLLLSPKFQMAKICQMKGHCLIF